MLILLVPVKAMAKENMVSLPADMYQLLQIDTRVKELLQGKKIEELNKEEIEKLQQIGVDLQSEIKSIGLVEYDEEQKKYIIKTGLSGRAEGVIKVGRYAVEVLPIDKVYAINPVKELIISNLMVNEVEIGLSDQQLGWFKRIKKKAVDWFKVGLVRLTDYNIEEQMRGEKAIEVAEGKIKLIIFNDKNLNGKKDEEEKIIPWANFEIRLKQVGKVQKEKLPSGVSKLRFKRLPKNIDLISSLLYEVSFGDSEKSLLSWQKKKQWQDAGVINGIFYGEDFKVNKNQEYELSLEKEAEVWWVY